MEGHTLGRRDAVVVGSGPNGLAAAAALAREGLDVEVLEGAADIGGGTRTRELTVPGVVHDVCSAFHPLGAASPFLRELPLTEHGLEWRWPPLGLAHPLDDGDCVVLHRSVTETALGLGADGRAWARLFAPIVERFDDLVAELMQPLAHLPRHPVALGRMGLMSLAPATMLTRAFRGERARALFAGIAAHIVHPLDRPLSSAAGVLLGAAGHAVGWPVAAGGSQTITRALASYLSSLGATITTGVEVTRLAELPRTRAALLDVAPSALVRIAGHRMAGWERTLLSRWRHGPGAFKLDLAVEGGIGWQAEPCRRAGTVHVGGTLEEIASAEEDVHAGRMPARPFVLVGQQYLADPGRSAGGVHPVWAYCHVPNGWRGDASDAILDQIERFAPGTRDRIVARRSWSTVELQAYNANYVGGDIATGANDPWQLLLRPRPALDPYRTSVPGLWLCSAATPPGGGVHGMCGANAAASVLRSLRR